MRIPMWLKIIAVLMLISLVASILGATLSESVVLPLILVVLALFPGKDADNPTLFKVMPWFWSLGLLIAIALLGASFMGKDLLGPEARAPSTLELWATILLTPLFLWTFIKRHRAFKTILVTSTVLFATIEIITYVDSAKTVKDVLGLAGDLFSEIFLGIYLFLKFKTPLKKPRR